MRPKDYAKWHRNKAYLHNTKIRPNFHEKEIWFCSLGSNIGYEQDGSGSHYLRSAIIVRKFNNQVALIVPLTKTAKTGVHYFSLQFRPNEMSTAILSQIRLIDGKRLQYKAGNISKANCNLLKQKLKQLIA